MDLDGLNPPQREAVLHPGGPLVVFAGAGSGKTRVITYRVARQVGHEGMPPHAVLAVTFTNKAAEQMRTRLGALLSPGRASELWVGTFHAVCARLLRAHADRIGIRKDFTIYDDGDQRALLARVLKDLGLEERRYPPKQIAARIDRAKQEVVGPDAFPAGDAWEEVVGRVYRAYQERLSACGALDFGDLLHRLVAALEADDGLRAQVTGRFASVLVDEYQDTNHVQYRFVRALCEGHRNLCVVGDDDQSIYRWRGADRRNILDFRRHYPDAHVVKLEQNYRSTQRILRVANAIIERNVDREPKRLWTANEEGPKALVVRCEDERDEAHMIVQAVRELLKDGRGLADAVVFYRTHAQSRVIEEALRAADLPYRVVGGTRFYDRAEVKDLLAYLRALNNPADEISVERIVNTPARGIGKTSLDRVREEAARSREELYATIQRAAQLDSLGKPARKRLAEFARLMEGLRADAASGMPVAELAEAVIERSGYLRALRDDDTPESDARLENLRELVGSMAEFQQEAEDPSLAAYLQLVTLQTSADDRSEGERLTLMTVHAAKGLEFPVVMVAGLEEQLFPLGRDELFEDPEEVEEERRLAYVAFTRAEQRLVLSWAALRRIYGQQRIGQPSRFLLELPADDVLHIGQRPVAVSRGGFVGSELRRAGDGFGDAPPPAPRRAVAGEWVDYDEADPEEAAAPRVGMRVRHAKFGVGRVRAVTEGLPPRVEVEFPGWGTKRVVASFLEPL